MLRSEGAVILMNEDKIRYLVGSKDIEVAPREPFSETVCNFFDDLAKELQKCDKAKLYPDILTFAFWIRKANISRLKEQMTVKQTRIGRGLVFHIAPSNVPINFAYSLAFGMLAGNVNIVRIPSKELPQVEIVCQCINQVLKEKYQELEDQLFIVKYEADKEITDFFSSICNARIIWGGDNAINEIRKSSLMPRSVEINFADRYSFGIINPETVLKVEDIEIKKLAVDFYNDTYLMDQNACSTPHMLFWKKTPGVTIEEAGVRLWKAVYEVAKEKYNLEGIKVSDKFTELYEYMAVRDNIRGFKKYDNYLYVLTLDNIEGALEDYRGKYGLFYEYEFENYDEIACLVNEKIQTCACFGIERKEIIHMVMNNRLKGIDRIVPFGKTLNIDLIWDGYDVIGNLSRIIG
ncbi:MAG: acyl-CoA reductase [Dehalobacterium sp.]